MDDFRASFACLVSSETLTGRSSDERASVTEFPDIVNPVANRGDEDPLGDWSVFVKLSWV